MDFKPMTKYQSDNIYVVNEWDMFELIQAYTRYLLKFEQKNDGYHPSANERDKWMCKYCKRKFNQLNKEKK